MSCCNAIMPSCENVLSREQMNTNILEAVKGYEPEIGKIIDYLNPLWFDSLSYTGNMSCYDKNGEYLPFVPHDLSQGFYKYKIEFYVKDEYNFYSGKKRKHWVFGKIQPFRKLRVLKLAVKEPWFTLMYTGEKTMEFRKPSKWIQSRLYDKDGNAREYDQIEITNGYGKHRPVFTRKYEGFGTGYNNQYTFSDGSKITPSSEDYALFLGDIIYKANIKN